MHLETLLYMLLQSNQTRPPGMTPEFELLAKRAQIAAVPNEWIEVPAADFPEGMDDPETDKGPDRYFGWDNEKPQRSLSVPAFEARARPITNEDYARFLEQSGEDKLPASWISRGSNTFKSDNAPQMNGDHSYGIRDGPHLDKSVRTVYGPVPLEYALHWPIFASYDELSRCAAWMGGRIPTVEEARSIYHYVDINKNKHTDSILTKKVSAVNGCDK